VSSRRLVGGILGVAFCLGAWFLASQGPACAQEQPGAPPLTIAQCWEDMEYLRTLNRLGFTAEQLAKAADIAAAYQLQSKQWEEGRARPAPQALLDARARLLRGETVSEEGGYGLLDEELAQQMALADQALYQAREQALTQLRALVTDVQVRRYVRSEGRLRRVDDLMDELAVSRSLAAPQWVEWQQRVIPGMVEMIVARDPQNATAPFEVASRFLEEARALSDADFAAQREALTRKLEQLVLPADYRPELEAEDAAGRLAWFLLERQGSPGLLQEAARARAGS
jgi:hypothetical protein